MNKEDAIDFFNWVIDTYQNDEARLPLSGNKLLGGRTIFIEGEEYPISELWERYIQSKIKTKK